MMKQGFRYRHATLAVRLAISAILFGGTPDARTNAGSPVPEVGRDSLRVGNLGLADCAGEDLVFIQLSRDTTCSCFAGAVRGTRTVEVPGPAQAGTGLVISQSTSVRRRRGLQVGLTAQYQLPVTTVRPRLRVVVAKSDATRETFARAGRGRPSTRAGPITPPYALFVAHVQQVVRYRLLRCSREKRRYRAPAHASAL